jgi:tyrosinase
MLAPWRPDLVGRRSARSRAMETLTPRDFELDFDLGAPRRRVFLQGLGYVSVGLLMGSLGGCETLVEAIRNRPIRRRLRVGSPEVDAAIATYRDAVTAMQGLASHDGRNWDKQAAIHGTAGVGFNFCQHGTTHFFDWHRAYLFYVEKICQKLTGNKQFALPYWNWNQDPDIHPAFLDTTSVLHLSRTVNSMSGSSSIATTTLDSIFADTNFFTFSAQLEGTPHNTVHSTIGGAFGGFGSARDPLFYMHHCMVDYSWYKWNVDLHNDNTNDSSWIHTDEIQFVDADGNAASMMAGITTLMPLLSYQYESSAIGSNAASESLSTRRAYQAVEGRLKAGANIRLDIKHRVRISEVVVTSIARPLSLQARLSPDMLAQIIDSDTARERIFASIEYARLPAASDFAVRVFVNLPTADRNTPNTDPHYAGSFAFFGTENPAAPATGAHHHAPKFLVNLTNAIQRLRQRRELGGSTPISLQLVPTPFADKPESEDTELVLNAFDIFVTPVIIPSAPR